MTRDFFNVFNTEKNAIFLTGNGRGGWGGGEGDDVLRRCTLLRFNSLALLVPYWTPPPSKGWLKQLVLAGIQLFQLMLSDQSFKLTRQDRSQCIVGSEQQNKNKNTKHVRLALPSKRASICVTPTY